MLPDGSLEILGRADNQIKLRGVRIESEGISHVFRTAAEQIKFGSIDAYTFLGQHPSFNSQQLVTLIAPLDREKVPMSVKKGGDFPALLKEPAFIRQLREVARTELATYMVPAHIIVAKWLPISSNGKADDKLMRSFFASLDVGTLGSLTQEMDGQDVEDSVVTDTEERLSNIIAQFSSLSPDEIKPTSNYFSCGLDSLKLIRISGAIHKEFGVVVSASELMREPTLRSTAEIIRNRNGTDTASGAEAAWEYLDQFAQGMRGEIESLRPISDIEAVYPTLPVQEGVLFSSLDDTTQYAQHFIFKLHESIDLPRLLKAWRTAQTRFEILR
jgi:acyl carrier protein